MYRLANLQGQIGEHSKFVYQGFIVILILSVQKERKENFPKCVFTVTIFLIPFSMICGSFFFALRDVNINLNYEKAITFKIFIFSSVYFSYFNYFYGLIIHLAPIAN